jgi:arabinofuranosyltransferase
MSIVATPGAPADALPELPRPQGWARTATVAGACAVVVLFAVLAIAHRWISDDGLIVVREVRQILAGNGPDYNPFQRDEVDTSVLWTWLLAVAGMALGRGIAVAAVVIGIECAVLGLLLALVGTARWHRSRGMAGLLVPAGALVPLGIVACWDFASSGLETGLSLLWLGLVWLLLTSVTDRTGGRRVAAVAVVIGLGPLVRPDFALVTAVCFAALVMLAGPGRRRAVGAAAAALALPLAYEVFRAGYYGITVPMSALAKEAAEPVVARGFAYLDDLVGTYQLWLPVAVLCVAGTRLLTRSSTDRRTVVLVGAPLVSGVLLGGYVVWAGGDYMHGRLWVPVVFTLLLPVLLLPAGRGYRTETVGVALLAVWALVAGLLARTPYQGTAFGPDGITDERGFEVAAYQEADPMTAESRTRDNDLLSTLAALRAGGARPLVLSSGKAANGPLWTIKLSPSLPDHSAFFYDNMGVTDDVVPLDGTVVDVNGLATPLAGHLELTGHGRAGHEKWLPVAWVLAEYADPAALATLPPGHGVTRAQVLAARHALTCGRLADLMASVDQPMSPGRFWHNLTGAVARTSLRVPADPFAAEREFCR